jgi:hypothetical protein
VGDETQGVPLRIDDGLPEPFAEVVTPFDERTWPLLLTRPLLHQGMRALRFLKHGFDWISVWSGFEPSACEYEEIRHVGISLYVLLRRLRGLDFAERVRLIQQDVLGAYFFRIPEVRLYWMVIGFLSGVLGGSVEALTLVAGTHELAHAYTHLGRDIDGMRWETESFAASNLAITEGLAQFYTKTICKKLDMRFPAGLKAYERLLQLQSGPYLVHEDWVKDGEVVGEIIRITMINCRSTRLVKLGRFEILRRQHAERLRDTRQQAVQKREETLEYRQKPLIGPTPTLPKAVSDAALWIGKYYFSGAITDPHEWCETIRDEIGPEVAPYLEDAWSRITHPPTGKEAVSA